MTTVTISPKFQIVIPEVIRRKMKLKAGEKVRVFSYDNRIEYIPIRRMRTLRGILSSMDTEIVREDDRL